MRWCTGPPLLGCVLRTCNVCIIALLVLAVQADPHHCISSVDALVGGRGFAGLERIFLDRDIRPECTFGRRLGEPLTLTEPGLDVRGCTGLPARQQQR